MVFSHINAIANIITVANHKAIMSRCTENAFVVENVFKVDDSIVYVKWNNVFEVVNNKLTDVQPFKV